MCLLIDFIIRKGDFIQGVIAEIEQAAQQQENMDNPEFIYPFPAKPAGGQVNTFVLFNSFLNQMRDCQMYSKEIENKKQFILYHLSLPFS
jgi:hypothetical protein